MWTIFKVLIELVTILFSFMVQFLGREACGILAPQLGIKLATPALKGKIFTPG